MSDAVDAWLDATHRIVEDEVAPALKVAGFKQRQYRWSRPRTAFTFNAGAMNARGET